MPLLHQDNSRGGGGNGEMPPWPYQSYAEFRELDNVKERVGAPAASKNNCGDWSWESPNSPQAAQTPRARVPAGSFPPLIERSFSSYSECAQLNGVWNGNEENCNGNGNGSRDLVSALKGLTLPGGAERPDSTELATVFSPPPSMSFDTSISMWHVEHCNVKLRDDSRINSRVNSRANLRSRRASFCGVESGDRNGGALLRWTGKLPARDIDPDGGFSPKLFIGGLPWDIRENSLMHVLKHFQPVAVEWPGREVGMSMRGFAYVTLESERRVRSLLAACRRDGDDWKYRMHYRKMHKEVQVIPWGVREANWMLAGAARLEAARTVFVGALHGMLSARALALIMNDLFPGVVYAGIDTDKNKYPIGSGRVTFNNVHSYVRAISAEYIEIITDKFTKKVQVDPYLEDSMCSSCKLQQGPYFCRQPLCFGYYCRSCWSRQHTNEEHKPLMRNSKTITTIPTTPSMAQTPFQFPPQASKPFYHTNGDHLARVSPPQTDLCNGIYSQCSEGTFSPSTSASGPSAGGSDGADVVAGAGHEPADSLC